LSKRWGWSPYHRWCSNQKLCSNQRLCSKWKVSGKRRLNRTTVSTNRNLQVWCNGRYSATGIKIARRKLRECRNKTRNRMPKRTPGSTRWGLRRCWNRSIQRMVLSLKFRPHVATRTPHRQNRKEVIHGTRLIPQHSKRVKTIQNGQKIARRFTSSGRARACAQQLRTRRAYVHKARLFGEKPARLLNDAFIETGRLPNH
jgi:hypothetical protein